MGIKRKVALALAVCLTAMGLGLASQKPARAAFGTDGPFFMFSAASPTDTFGVLNRYFQTRDFISKSVSTADTVVSARIRQKHTYTLQPSLADVQSSANVGCSTGADPGLIIYDPEHWTATPPEEQADVPTTIAQGSQIAHNAGCDYGVTPDGEFLFGKDAGSCSYNLSNGIYSQVDWTLVDYLDIQAQILLSDTCWPTLGIAAYVDVVSTLANYARSQNPNVKVAAQVSLKFTPPDRIISALDAVKSYAEGVYVAYPSTCSYCSSTKLRTVFQAFRGAPFFLHSVLDQFGVRGMDGYPPGATSPATLSLNTVGGPMNRWTTLTTYAGGTVIPSGSYSWSYYTDGVAGTTARLGLEFGYCLENTYCSQENRVAIISQTDWTVTVTGASDGLVKAWQTAQSTTLPPGGPYKLYFVINVLTPGDMNLLYDYTENPIVLTNTLQP